MRMPDQREVDKPAASRGRCRPAQAASVPAALLNLQRLAGNQAVSIALRKMPPPQTSTDDATRVPVQRVGGKKIGFDLAMGPGKKTKKEKETIREGQKLLTDEWAKVRKAIRDKKVGTDKIQVETSAKKMIEIRTREKERDEYLRKGKELDQIDIRLPELKKPGPLARGFTKFYSDLLTGDNKNDQVALLKSLPPFKSRQLELRDDNTLWYHPRTIPGAPIPAVQIGTLKVDEDAFRKAKTPPDTSRELYTKVGDSSPKDSRKEYVKDSRGVITRRYAYVEKNYYQMMEFFMTHKHEGRFQSYMRAAGEAVPNIYEHRDDKVDMVIPGAVRAPGQQLSREQMAIAHQKLGSGPQQRGVSLTSTPKVGATYVNTGENFRTKRGFRLKIDLHKIPLDATDGPLLINHYGAGGVIDTSDTEADTRRDRIGGKKYPYKESSIHARELFLEHLKPEWIVEIEHHDNLTLGTILETSPTVDSANLFSTAKKRFGGEEYEKGFDFGLTSDKDPDTSADPNYREGFNGARTFVKGWKKGNNEAPKSTAKQAAEEKAWKDKDLTRAQYIYDQTINNKAHSGEYDLFHLGYLRGRAGKDLIKTHEGLKILDK